MGLLWVSERRPYVHQVVECKVGKLNWMIKCSSFFSRVGVLSAKSILQSLLPPELHAGLDSPLALWFIYLFSSLMSVKVFFPGRKSFVLFKEKKKNTHAQREVEEPCCKAGSEVEVIKMPHPVVLCPALQSAGGYCHGFVKNECHSNLRKQNVLEKKSFQIFRSSKKPWDA